METHVLDGCPICRQKVSPFEFNAGNDTTTTIECVRCGKFRVGGEFSRSIFDKPLDEPHLYSGAIRELNERGINVPIIENREDFLFQVNVPKDPLDMMDRFLMSLRNRTTNTMVHVGLSEHDFPLAYAQEKGEWMYLAGQMQHLGLIDSPGNWQFRINPAGWQRLRELAEKERKFDQAFVAMSFAKDMDFLFDEAIKPALEATGYKPLRVDRKEHDEKIDDLIIAEIRRSGLVIADFTKQSKGVYFEAGFALGLGTHIIRSCKDDEDELNNLHFDTRQWNHILWTDANDLKKKLINRIRATAPIQEVV